MTKGYIKLINQTKISQRKIYKGKKIEEIVLNAQSDVKRLMFIFHGYGADKDDLYPIGKKIHNAIPKMEIHLPNGIEKCDSGFGYQWFALAGNDIKTWEQAFKENSSKIKSYIDATISKKNLSYKDIILSGFSQGAMLSLSLGLEYKVEAIVAFSGLLLNSEIYTDNQDTKVFLAHGAEDNVIPIDAMYSAKDTLKKAGIDVQTAVSPKLLHGIDDYLLTQAVDFLSKL